MSDEAVAYWSDALGQVTKTEAWQNEYLKTNQLIDQYMNTDEATRYVTAYETVYMADNGLS